MIFFFFFFFFFQSFYILELLPFANLAIENLSTGIQSLILLPAHPASFAHKFLFQRVPVSPRMQ